MDSFIEKIGSVSLLAIDGLKLLSRNRGCRANFILIRIHEIVFGKACLIVVGLDFVSGSLTRF